MNKTIGILHLTFPYGGAETATIQLARELSAEGFHIYVFCTDFRENRAAGAAGHYQVEVMPDTAHPNSARNARFLAERSRQLGIGCLCISFNGFLPLMRQLRTSGGPRLVYIQHGQPFWEKQSRLDAGARRGFMKFRVACIDRVKEKLFGYYSRQWEKAYAALYENCDAYVTLHPQYSREIQKAVGCDGAKFTAIPNMVEPAGPPPETKKKQLLYSGRMSYNDKRVDRLIRVWAAIHARIPDWELVLVGDGKERKQLQALSARLALPKIRFEGWQKDVTRYYREASVICLTSTFESFGLCLTEGMSQGCVPVAFDCSAGVADIVRGNGELVPPFNLKSYADALLRLTTDDAYRETLRLRSLDAVRRFYPQEIIPRWTGLFERLQAESQENPTE